MSDKGYPYLEHLRMKRSHLQGLLKRAEDACTRWAHKRHEAVQERNSLFDSLRQTDSLIEEVEQKRNAEVEAQDFMDGLSQVVHFDDPVQTAVQEYQRAVLDMRAAETERDRLVKLCQIAQEKAAKADRDAGDKRRRMMKAITDQVAGQDQDTIQCDDRR